MGAKGAGGKNSSEQVTIFFNLCKINSLRFCWFCHTWSSDKGYGKCLQLVIFWQRDKIGHPFCPYVLFYCSAVPDQYFGWKQPCLNFDSWLSLIHPPIKKKVIFVKIGNSGWLISALVTFKKACSCAHNPTRMNCLWWNVRKRWGLSLKIYKHPGGGEAEVTLFHESIWRLRKFWAFIFAPWAITVFLQQLRGSSSSGVHGPCCKKNHRYGGAIVLVVLCWR